MSETNADSSELPEPWPECPDCGGTGTIRQGTAAIWADEVLACMCIYDQMFERDRREGHVASDLPIIRNPLHFDGSSDE